MSYQIIKKSLISVKVILFIFFIMFSAKIPKGFYISIIKPIFKDPNLIGVMSTAESQKGQF